MGVDLASMEAVPSPRWAALLVLIGAALPGCVSDDASPFQLVDTPPPIWFGGLHPVWTSTGVDIEGYAINMGDEVLPADVLRVSGHVVTPERDYIERRSVASEMGPWAPNETRQFRMVYEGVAAQPIAHFSTLEIDAFNVDYFVTCVSPNHEPTSGCGIEDDAYSWFESSTLREPADYAKLRECCEWEPPPFDVIDMACVLDTVTIRCDFGVLNYRAATYAGELHATLYSISPVDRARVEEASAAVEFGAPLEGRQSRPYAVEFPVPAPGSPLGTGAYEVTVVASRADLPRSAAMETASIEMKEMTRVSSPAVVLLDGWAE